VFSLYRYMRVLNQERYNAISASRHSRNRRHQVKRRGRHNLMITNRTNFSRRRRSRRLVRPHHSFALSRVRRLTQRSVVTIVLILAIAQMFSNSIVETAGGKYQAVQLGSVIAASTSSGGSSTTSIASFYTLTVNTCTFTFPAGYTVDVTCPLATSSSSTASTDSSTSSSSATAMSSIVTSSTSSISQHYSIDRHCHHFISVRSGERCRWWNEGR